MAWRGCWLCPAGRVGDKEVMPCEANGLWRTTRSKSIWAFGSVSTFFIAPVSRDAVSTERIHISFILSDHPFPRITVYLHTSLQYQQIIS
jgi:hypothetical protein